LFVRRAAEGVPISGPIGIGNCSDGALVASRGWQRPFDDPIPYRAVANSFAHSIVAAKIIRVGISQAEAAEVEYREKRSSLGTAKAGARSMTEAGN
jgi:hypothetical protein